MKDQDPRESAPTPSLREIGGRVNVGAKKGAIFLLGGEGRAYSGDFTTFFFWCASLTNSYGARLFFYFIFFTRSKKSTHPLDKSDRAIMYVYIHT